ncbi:MAG: c-type cytochrome domain-containing protein [Planctomycetota bacterium]|nr:c-type cytochrome domain-containing protein [Planctomycetota bacterium]
MMIAGRYLLCAMALSAVAVSQNAPAADGQDALSPSYVREVLPILRANCYGCHQPAKAKGGIVVTDHAALLEPNEDELVLVVPGDPDASLLLEVVTPGDGEPPAMPPKGAPLDAEEVDVLRRWIAAGAVADGGSSAVWATPEKPPVYRRPAVVTAVDYSPDGALLAVSGQHEILLHRADGSELVARLIGMSQRIESLAFSPDGKRLAVVGGSPGLFGEVQIWDVADRRLELSKLVTDDCLFGVSWSHDSKLVAFGCTDSTMRVIEADTGEQVLFQGAHDDWVLDTVFSTDASHLVTVSRDMSMKLVLVPEQQFIDNITSITPGVLRGGLMAVDRHPHKDELLIGGADGEPKLFRMYREKKRVIGDDYNRIRAFESLPGRIFAARFGGDGERIVVGSSDRGRGFVRSYVTGDGKTLWTREFDGGIYSVAFRPDGAVVAAAGFDGALHLLDAETGESVHEFVAVPVEPSAAVDASVSDEQEERGR